MMCHSTNKTVGISKMTVIEDARLELLMLLKCNGNVSQNLISKI